MLKCNENAFRNKITQQKVNIPSDKLILPSGTKITATSDVDYEFVSTKIYFCSLTFVQSDALKENQEAAAIFKNIMYKAEVNLNALEVEKV